jgi:hypothetical protein
MKYGGHIKQYLYSTSMQFASGSEDMMELFIRQFPTLISREPSHTERRKENAVLLGLYRDVRTAEERVNASWRTGHVKKKVEQTTNIKSISGLSLMSSTYVPKDIRTYVEEHLVGTVSYGMLIGEREVTIVFMLLSQDSFNKLGSLESYAREMFVWLDIVGSYASSKCSQTLNIYCALTPFEKALPPSQCNIIGPWNCNTAVTTSCQRAGEILIYRKEELFKVFIHETFHVFGLDFSAHSNEQLNRKLRLLFPIKTDYNAFEAYAEFWAEIINCVFCSYKLLSDKTNKNKFLTYCHFCIHFEQIFSMFQMAKVLDFMGIDYTSLYAEGEPHVATRKYLYKERSNVFAYYIIKALLMYYSADFMVWCKLNNSNILRFSKGGTDRFLTFIVDHYVRHDFVKDQTRVREFLHDLQKKRPTTKYKTILRSMRMSICGLVPQNGIGEN